MLFRLVFALLSLFILIPSAFAQDQIKPDDVISYDLSAESWVVTKTAHVVLEVEAAVSASTAGSARADMTKAINEAAKADWRLTGFNRMLDQTGMERWSLSFEARLPETALGGLRDAVKKASKAGMQITVSGMDFTPSHDEMEAARADLRAQIFKQAAEQLASLNTTLPGRNYRISQIAFETDFPAPIQMFRGKRIEAAVATASVEQDQGQDVSQKLVMNAHITYAALPAVSK